MPRNSSHQFDRHQPPCSLRHCETWARVPSAEFHSTTISGHAVADLCPGSGFFGLEKATLPWPTLRDCRLLFPTLSRSIVVHEVTTGARKTFRTSCTQDKQRIANIPTWARKSSGARRKRWPHHCHTAHLGHLTPMAQLWPRHTGFHPFAALKHKCLCSESFPAADNSSEPHEGQNRCHNFTVADVAAYGFTSMSICMWSVMQLER